MSISCNNTTNYITNYGNAIQINCGVIVLGGHASLALTKKITSLSTEVKNKEYTNDDAMEVSYYDSEDECEGCKWCNNCLDSKKRRSQDDVENQSRKRVKIEKPEVTAGIKRKCSDEGSVQEQPNNKRAKTFYV